MDYLPLHFKLEGDRVLIVGGGDLAFNKAMLLTRAGARILFVAPQFSNKVLALGDQGLAVVWFTGAGGQPQLKLAYRASASHGFTPPMRADDFDDLRSTLLQLEFLKNLLDADEANSHAFGSLLVREAEKLGSGGQ